MTPRGPALPGAGKGSTSAISWFRLPSCSPALDFLKGLGQKSPTSKGWGHRSCQLHISRETMAQGRS